MVGTAEDSPISATGPRRRRKGKGAASGLGASSVIQACQEPMPTAQGTATVAS